MRQRKFTYLIISIFLIVVFILPYIYISKYTVFVADDLCGTFDISFLEYLKVVKNWYFAINGRYTNAVISSIPINNLTIYRVVIASQFLLLGYILFRFFKKLTGLFGFQLHSSRLSLLVSLVYINIIAILPSPFEFFYWYAASTVYLFSFVIFLLFLEMILKYYLNQKVNALWMLFLIVFLNGNSELFIGITNLLLLGILVADSLKNRKLNWTFLVLNILSWISTLAMIFAPGMSARRGVYEYGGNLYGSIKVAILYGAKYFVLYFFEFPFIIFYIFFFIFIYKNIKLKDNLRFLPPMYVLVVSYLSFISMIFTIYYATGLLSIHDGRTGNIVRLVYLILILLNIINLAIYIRRKTDFRIPYLSYFGVATGLLFLVTIALNNKNYNALYVDFSQHRFEHLEKELAERNRKLENIAKEQDTLKLKMISGSLILKSGDEVLKSQEWAKDCYLKFVNKRKGLKLKDIQFKE